MQPDAIGRKIIGKFFHVRRDASLNHIIFEARHRNRKPVRQENVKHMPFQNGERHALWYRRLGFMLKTMKFDLGEEDGTMRALEDVEPKEVFHFFEDLAAIPRPSYHEKEVSDYLVRFAKDRGLEVHQDSMHNVIMIKEASEGYEDQEPLAFQAHMYMVCEEDPGVEKDMEKEGIDLEVDGDYLRAKGTTLGGDDGIGVSFVLALLDSDTIKHPRLEFVCTVCEEVGMDGARDIDLAPLKARRLINLDHETEGSALAGCAGGGTAEVGLSVHRAPYGWEKLFVRITGLLGGHSGGAITLGRASSVELMGRLLRGISSVTDIRLIACENGSKDNAISREGWMSLAVKDKEAALKKLEETGQQVQEEYKGADPGIRIFAEEDAGKIPAGLPKDPVSKEETENIISLLTELPQGVQRMSDSLPGMVETSLNWGIASLGEERFRMSASVRSSVGTAKDALFGRLQWTAEHNGASMKIVGAYPAWQWVEKSALRDKVSHIYKEMFGKELRTETIHAGVECGLLGSKIQGLDMVALGPDMEGVHTPKERLSIPSVKRMWDFLVKVVETKD